MDEVFAGLELQPGPRQQIARGRGEACHEGRQVAVAFDYKAPLSNKILTNGFSIVLRTPGPVPAGFDIDAFGAEVRNAFQSAISLWTSSVKDIEARLSPDLRNFLDGRTSRSPNGYSLGHLEQ